MKKYFTVTAKFGIYTEQQYKNNRHKTALRWKEHLLHNMRKFILTILTLIIDILATLATFVTEYPFAIPKFGIYTKKCSKNNRH